MIKLRIIFLIFLILLLLPILRYYELSKDRDIFVAKGINQSTVTEINFLPRGKIVDRNNSQLALDVVRQTLLFSKQAQKETVFKLAKAEGIPIFLNSNRRLWFENEIDVDFLKKAKIACNCNPIQEPRSRRYYPYGSITSTVIGFAGTDGGLEGVEKVFENEISKSELSQSFLRNRRGEKIFGDLTTQIYSRQQETGIQDRIAIILDGEELIAPSVKSPITAGTAFIDGPDFTIERVRDLALLLESGRLPIPIKLIQERDVDAILGAESLEKSVVAGGVGLLLVLLFMTLYYRLPGIIAALALLIYSIIVLSIFKILPVTLTLSGVAAAILSIGMAVDANILIFERMKDELRIGRTLLTSINTGFNRAWPAIRDGNVSTLITCGILYWFSEQLGATIVQGFAATLAIGVSISMISAIFVSRTLMRLLALSPISKNISLFIPSGGGEISKKLKS